MNDLDPEELSIHRLLAAARPEPLPLGFRDAVMKRVRTDGTPSRWEWIFAAILAVPSFGYLAQRAIVSGSELGTSISAILVAAQGLDATSGADVVVDGLAVISLALVAIGSAVAAHAMLRTPDRHRVIAR
ncbi:MAG TPA: hypothetical protein VGA38_02810 [Candidatus Limnocylindria bacterium]